MRNFNKSEQEIIRKISKITSHEVTIDFLVKNIFIEDKFILVIDKKTGDNIWLCISIKEFDKIDKQKLHYENFSKTLELFRYLIDNRYVLQISGPQILRPKPNCDVYFHIDKNYKIEYKAISINNNTKTYCFLTHKVTNESLQGAEVNDFKDDIYKYFDGLIFPSEELIQLVKDEFESEGDKQIKIAKENLKWTKFAMIAPIIVTLILGIVSCILSCKQLNLGNEQLDCAKIGSTSENIDSLYARTARHSDSLYKVFLQDQLKLKSEKNRDTLNVKVVNMPKK